MAGRGLAVAVESVLALAQLAREPDDEAGRALFTELEFTTLLKDFAPGAELGATDYREAAAAEDVEQTLAALPKGDALALALAGVAPRATKREEKEEEDNEETELPLAPASEELAAARKLAISAATGSALALAPCRTTTTGSPAPSPCPAGTAV